MVDTYAVTEEGRIYLENLREEFWTGAGRGDVLVYAIRENLTRRICIEIVEADNDYIGDEGTRIDVRELGLKLLPGTLTPEDEEFLAVDEVVKADEERYLASLSPVVREKWLAYDLERAECDAHYEEKLRNAS